MEHLLEICVDSLESAQAAQQGGATRLELCANLIIGGTSPSPYLIRQVLDTVHIPVHVLLRPRFGDFCFTETEKQIILEEIENCRQLGVHGIVIGALNPDGTLDRSFLSECKMVAGSYLRCTLHRAFDVCSDPYQALEQAVSLGFDTILTSGQQATAEQGIVLLKTLVEQAKGRIEILVGSGVNIDNIPAFAALGIRQFHLSAKKKIESPMRFRREGISMGLPLANEFLREYTDAAVVAEVKRLLESL